MNTRDMNAVLRKVYLAGVRYGVGDAFGTLQMDDAISGKVGRPASEIQSWIAGAEARAGRNFLPVAGDPSDLMDGVIHVAHAKLLATEPK